MSKYYSQELTRVVTGFTCDFCSKTTDFDTVSVSFGYGSIYDMAEFDFCSDECLKAGILDLDNTYNSWYNKLDTWYTQEKKEE